MEITRVTLLFRTLPCLSLDSSGQAAVLKTLPGTREIVSPVLVSTELTLLSSSRYSHFLNSPSSPAESQSLGMSNWMNLFDLFQETKRLSFVLTEPQFCALQQCAT